ncbi:putative atp synthase f1 delta subunit [Trichuris trichiura]|uniref:Putative atp synthase f1 delta subunit n=1 Tax=Trichuris trichiura TaxID=36087 RepID=A0A077Z7Z0_TRITR|nr:putative atp synthase f1 delta subunit [Trichuris trichiura]
MGSGEYILQVAKMDNLMELVDFVLNNYLPREPLYDALGTTKERDRPGVTSLVDVTLRDSVSLFFRDKGGKIAACVLNSLVTVESGSISSFLNTVKDHLDPSVLANANFYMEVTLLSVSPKSTGRGLAKKLIEASLERAKQLQCAFVLAVATGFKSQTLFAKCGFECAYAVPYKDYLDSNGKQLFECRNSEDDSANLRITFPRLYRLGSLVIRQEDH